jgi:polyketide synthase 12/myxalamid-type polyketide synthase MxaB
VSEGVRALSVSEALDMLGALLDERAESAWSAVLHADWTSLTDARGGPESAPPLFSHLAKSRRAGSGARAHRTASPQRGDPRFMETLRGAPPARRKGLLVQYVRTQAARALGVASPEDLDAVRPLQEAGLDSLMAVELRTLLSNGLELPRALPATVALDHPTIAALAGLLERELFPAGAEAGADAGDTAFVSEVRDLSEDEAERKLLAELDDLAELGNAT